MNPPKPQPSSTPRPPRQAKAKGAFAALKQVRPLRCAANLCGASPLHVTARLVPASVPDLALRLRVPTATARAPRDTKALPTVRIARSGASVRTLRAPVLRVTGLVSLVRGMKSGQVAPLLEPAKAVRLAAREQRVVPTALPVEKVAPRVVKGEAIVRRFVVKVALRVGLVRRSAAKVARRVDHVLLSVARGRTIVPRSRAVGIVLLSAAGMRGRGSALQAALSRPVLQGPGATATIVPVSGIAPRVEIAPASGIVRARLVPPPIVPIPRVRTSSAKVVRTVRRAPTSTVPAAIVLIVPALTVLGVIVLIAPALTVLGAIARIAPALTVLVPAGSVDLAVRVAQAVDRAAVRPSAAVLPRGVVPAVLQAMARVGLHSVLAQAQVQTAPAVVLVALVAASAVDQSGTRQEASAHVADRKDRLATVRPLVASLRMKHE